MEDSRHHSESAERAVIGALMLKPEIVSWLDLEPGQFFNPRHRHIWAAAQELHAEGVDPDPITVVDRLSRKLQPDAVGGPSYLAELMGECITADNVEHYAAILRTKATTRRVLELSAETAHLVERGVEGDELLDAVQLSVSRIEPASRHEGVMSDELAVSSYKAILDDMREREAGGSVYVGVPTGLPGLDALICGTPLGILTLIGGLAGTGKSTLSINLANNAAERDYGVHIVSYEDRAETYGDRDLAREAGVPVQRIRARHLSSGEVQALAAAAERLRARRGWLLDFMPGASIAEVVRRVRSRRRENGTQLVMLDYIQCVPDPHPRMKRNDAIEENLRQLNDLAVQDDLAVVVFSQFNRKFEAREDKRPRMPDFRDSGSLEQKAKLMIGMYYPCAHEKDADPEQLDLLVLKNHQGEGNVTLSVSYKRALGQIS